LTLALGLESLRDAVAGEMDKSLSPITGNYGASNIPMQAIFPLSLSFCMTTLLTAIVNNQH
jgi:hypothetical protein